MTWAPAARKRYRIWPIRAVRDPAQPPARGEDEVYRLVNCHAQDGEVGPLVVGRAGFTKLGAGGTAQLGSGSNRTGQLVMPFTKRDGTTYTVIIVGGKFYTLDWGTDVLTEVVTSANFVTAFGGAVTDHLSATSRYYGTVFNDLLIISDGVHIPWSWTGASGAGGIAKLSNCPVLYGQPVVYYAKLFGIKNAARSTIVWSEEGAENTGYEAGGYNNAWDLVQTSTEAIEALEATDEALYVARANSITAISGPVSTDFRTSGTREAVSARIGTKSPGAFKVINGRVWFQDQFGQFRITSGGEPEEIGTGSRTTMRQVPTANYPDTQIVDDPENGHVKYYVSASGKDYPSFVILLDRSDGSYVGEETGYETTRVGQVLNGTGTPTIIHIGGATATTVNSSSDGYAYAHGHPNSTVWNDGFHAATVAIGHGIETGFAGNDSHVEKVFVRGEIALVQPTTLTGATVVFTVPNGASSPLVLENVAGGGPQYDTGLQYDDGVQYAAGGGEQKITFQMRQRGRWCRVAVSHGVANERIAISEMAIEAVPVSRRPLVT